MSEQQTVLLNANIGATNIIDKKKIDKIMGGTIDIIEQTLLQHNGPYGTMAMITPPANNPLEAPTFTKDGINIVKAIHFANPIERYTKDMIAHIGSSIERSAGDGTTSSMILTAKLIRKIRKIVSQNRFITQRNFTEAYDRVLFVITELLNDTVIIPDADDKALIFGIAYNQSMTSSHGDEELSKLVAELFVSMPKETWRHIVFKREQRETDERYRIESDDSSYSLDGYLFDNMMLNHNTATQYKDNDTDLHILSTGCISTSPAYHELLATLKDRTRLDKPLMVVAPYAADATVTNTLKTEYRRLKKEGISFTYVTVPQEHYIVNDINGLFATAGYHLDRCPETTIKLSGVDVLYKDHRLYLYNMVTYTDNGKHPDMDKVNSPVQLLMHSIEDFIQDVESNPLHSEFATIPSLAKQIANNITCKVQASIVIGGSGYENKAAMDVLLDVLTAVRIGLTKGVVQGGYKSLLTVIQILAPKNTKTHNQRMVSDPNITNQDIAHLILHSYSESITELLDSIYASSPHGIKLNKNGAITDRGGIGMDVITGDLHRFCKTTLCSDAASDRVITQPLQTDLAFVKRFGEVATKFLFANKVLIPNSVYIEQK